MKRGYKKTSPVERLKAAGKVGRAVGKAYKGMGDVGKAKLKEGVVKTGKAWVAASPEKKKKILDIAKKGGKAAGKAARTYGKKTGHTFKGGYARTWGK